VRLITSPYSHDECHGNLGASTSWNPLGHTGPVTGLMYLYLFTGMEVITNSAREEIDHLTKDDVIVIVCVWRCK